MSIKQIILGEDISQRFFNLSPSGKLALNISSISGNTIQRRDNGLYVPGDGVDTNGVKSFTVGQNASVEWDGIIYNIGSVLDGEVDIEIVFGNTLDSAHIQYNTIQYFDRNYNTRYLELPRSIGGYKLYYAAFNTISGLRILIESNNKVQLFEVNLLQVGSSDTYLLSIKPIISFDIDGYTTLPPGGGEFDPVEGNLDHLTMLTTVTGKSYLVSFTSASRDFVVIPFDTETNTVVRDGVITVSSIAKSNLDELLLDIDTITGSMVWIDNDLKLNALILRDETRLFTDIPIVVSPNTKPIILDMDMDVTKAAIGIVDRSNNYQMQFIDVFGVDVNEIITIPPLQQVGDVVLDITFMGSGHAAIVVRGSLVKLLVNFLDSNTEYDLGAYDANNSYRFLSLGTIGGIIQVSNGVLFNHYVLGLDVETGNYVFSLNPITFNGRYMALDYDPSPFRCTLATSELNAFYIHPDTFGLVHLRYEIMSRELTITNTPLPQSYLATLMSGVPSRLLFNTVMTNQLSFQTDITGDNITSVDYTNGEGGMMVAAAVLPYTGDEAALIAIDTIKREYRAYPTSLNDGSIDKTNMLDQIVGYRGETPGVVLSPISCFASIDSEGMLTLNHVREDKIHVVDLGQSNVIKGEGPDDYKYRLAIGGSGEIINVILLHYDTYSIDEWKYDVLADTFTKTSYNLVKPDKFMWANITATANYYIVSTVIIGSQRQVTVYDGATVVAEVPVDAGYSTLYPIWFGEDYFALRYDFDDNRDNNHYNLYQIEDGKAVLIDTLDVFGVDSTAIFEGSDVIYDTDNDIQYHYQKFISGEGLALVGFDKATRKLFLSTTPITAEVKAGAGGLIEPNGVPNVFFVHTMGGEFYWVIQKDMMLTGATVLPMPLIATT